MNPLARAQLSSPNMLQIFAASLQSYILFRMRRVHYVTHVLEDGVWYEYDDKTQEAYLLFFVKA